MAPPSKSATIEQLTDDQIEEIAERAAEKAIQKVTDHIYKEVGRGVLQKLAYAIGACVVGLALWLKAKGLV